MPRPRPRNDATPAAIAAAEKFSQALELRKRGASFAQIAEALGYSDSTGAHYAVKTALKRTLQQPADELRALEAERLDLAQRAIAVQVQAGDPTAVALWIRLSESRRKLFGLDAPQKVAGPDGGPLTLTYVNDWRSPQKGGA